LATFDGFLMNRNEASAGAFRRSVHHTRIEFDFAVFVGQTAITDS
jgi:hypothetical protein